MERAHRPDEDELTPAQENAQKVQRISAKADTFDEFVQKAAENASKIGISIFYGHLPFLGLRESESVSAVGGSVRRMEIAEFKMLDEDWAWKDRWSNPVFWVYPIPPNCSDKLLHERLGRVHLASVLVSKLPLPDPRLSVCYCFNGEKGVVQGTIGPLQRTWLLQPAPLDMPEPETLLCLGRTADWLEERDIDPNHPIFAVLHAFGASAARLTVSTESVAFSSIMVGLEGIFAPGRRRGIASRMAANMGRVMQTDRVADLQEELRMMYALRSDILHGRPFDSDATTAGLHRAASLACQAMHELLYRLDESHLTLDELKVLQQGWD